jgi:hypothetical protein
LAIHPIQYFNIAIEARIVQKMLKIITDGSVFLLEDQIKAIEDISAKMYSHHHCLFKRRPGKIITTFVIKAKNSIVFTLFQYDLFFIFKIEYIKFFCNFITNILII